jgi:glycosyltransferase involved in cell wall biosynthesis
VKILMLCYEFPPVGGGGAKVAFGLSRELVRMGHAVDVVTMAWRERPRYQELDGVKVHRAPAIRRAVHVCTGPEAFSYVLGALPLVCNLVNRGRYDVNHTHFIFPDGVIAWLLRRRFGLPYVITAHGSDVPGYNPHRLRRAHRVLAPAWRRVVQGASGIICPSEGLRSLVHRQPVAANTVVIPNGFDCDRFRASSHGERILIATRLLERKGVQHLLRAVEGLPLAEEIQIAGDGPYLPTLQRLAAESRVPVKFWKWLDNGSPELAALYQNSGIFVLPSEAENFPIALLEAMAAGLAIVTTRGTGCAEVVGDAALLVPPNDVPALRAAMCRLLEDPALRARLGEAARRRVAAEFSWRAVAEQYLALYQRHGVASTPCRP